jgi:hypothetical protein
LTARDNLFRARTLQFFHRGWVMLLAYSNVALPLRAVTGIVRAAALFWEGPNRSWLYKTQA